MKKCPFCAEEIQVEAVKCKHCGEWLNKTEVVYDKKSLSNLKSSFFNKDKQNRIPLVDLKKSKLVLYIACLSLIPIVTSVLMVLTLKSLANEFPEDTYRLLLLLLYVCLGVWIANYIYKIKQLNVMLAISVVIYLIARAVMISMYNNTYFSEVMVEAILVTIATYGTATILAHLFRYFDPKYDYTSMTGVHEMKDGLGKAYDVGVCSKCNQVVTVATQGAIKMFGKKEKHFCDNCGRFVHGSPLNNVFLGLSLVFATGMLLCGTAAAHHGNSNNNGIQTLVYLVLIGKGLKLTFFATTAIFNKPKSRAEAIAEHQNEKSFCARCAKPLDSQDGGNVCQGCQLS